MNRWWLYLLVFLSLFSVPGALARTIRVDQRSSAPSADGASWATAYPAIIPALNRAQPGDEIWVAAGIYPEHLLMKPGVGLYGGFVGTEAFRAQRPGRPDLTVLDGRLVGPVVTFHPTATPETVLDGFTIRNGRVLTSQGGGGIRCSGSPTITHNIITSNTTDEKGTYPGGGILVSSGSAEIRDNIIVGNSGNGGGIGIQAGSPRIVNNTLAANSPSAIAFTGNVAPGTVIANNIIADNMVGITFMTSTPGGAIHHNAFHGNALGDAMANRQPVTLPDNLSADPLFVDPAHGQFHIQPDSPCVDAGDDALAQEGETDIDLLPRRMGQAVDIGADESDGRFWPPAYVPIIYVSKQGSDQADGLSWATAKASVQVGIDLAADLGGGEVWVASGQYYETRPFYQSRFVYGLRPFVHVYGGFAGTEVAREERDWNSHLSILLQNFPNSVVGPFAGHRATTLDGFILLGAGVKEAVMGGGVSCTSASAILRNNAIIGIRGSGVFCFNSAPVIEWNTIRGNVVTSPGGGVYAENAAPEIRNNVIAANAIQGTGLFGAVFLRLSNATIHNNLIHDNTTGVYMSASSATITNNTFVNNGDTALQVDSGSMATFANNISAFHDREPLITPVTNRYIVRHNCVFDAAVRSFPVGYFGNIAAYPEFADLWAGDYRLLPASPCVDKGDDAYVGAGDLDLDGNLRLMGAHVDMGAYESPWIGVVTKPEMAAALLRIVGGLSPAAPGEMMAVDTGAPAGLDITDVLRIMR